MQTWNPESRIPESRNSALAAQRLPASFYVEFFTLLDAYSTGVVWTVMPVCGMGVWNRLKLYSNLFLTIRLKIGDGKPSVISPGDIHTSMCIHLLINWGSAEEPRRDRVSIRKYGGCSMRSVPTILRGGSRHMGTETIESLPRRFEGHCG